MHEDSPENRIEMADEFAHLTHMMSRTFDETLLRDLLDPFDRPSDDDAFFHAWHDAETRSKEGCEAAILEWIPQYRIPEMDNLTAYFLYRRFEHCSEFLMRLLCYDQTMFCFLGDSFGDFIWWLLTDWWQRHGQMDAFLADLDAFLESEKHDEA